MVGYILDHFSMPVMLWVGAVKPFIFRVAIVMVALAAWLRCGMGGSGHRRHYNGSGWG
jgi:hypothetical protein